MSRACVAEYPAPNLGSCSLSLFRKFSVFSMPQPPSARAKTAHCLILDAGTPICPFHLGSSRSCQLLGASAAETNLVLYCGVVALLPGMAQSPYLLYIRLSTFPMPGMVSVNLTMRPIFRHLG